MKARGRPAKRHAARPESVTADLFSPGPASASNHPPAAVPALTVAPAAPPLRSRAQSLWYVVVFPDLKEPQAAAMLERLGRCAQRFTSLVSLEPPNALMLEIKGSVRLFGSLDALRAAIDAAWNGLGCRAQSATAPTTVAALWLARAGRRLCIEDTGSLAGGLAEVPIACTCWDPEWLQTLRTLGLTRVGELLRLPRAGLARRLSPAALLELDIAVGRHAAPRRLFMPRERFRMRCDFEAEIDCVEYLQKATEPLIEHCARFLRVRQAGVQVLELKLRHRLLPPSRVRLGLASITGERRRLAAVLEATLRRLELAAPVRGMELLSGALQPLAAVSLDVFAQRGSGGDTAPQLVERLRARLGETAVYGVTTVAEHRPEAAWQRVHEILSAAIRAGDRSDPGMPRPVWLLADPAPLSVADLQQLRQGDLALEAGPERIESGWWDGKGIARDYYIARRTHGARWWIFQERQSRCWYLHGVFA